MVELKARSLVSLHKLGGIISLLLDDSESGNGAAERRHAASIAMQPIALRP